jgi:drug/metabolite transporter (DMT)-like permease
MQRPFESGSRFEEDEMQTSYLRGVLSCLVATVSWGCMFPVMTSALTRMDPFNFTAIRYTIASIPFAVLLLAREGKRAFNLKDERYVLAWLCGTAGFAGFGFLMFLGQQLAGPTGALSAAIMAATMPLLALPVNWVMRGARPPLYSIGFILLAFIGVVLVITKGNSLDAFDQTRSCIANIALFVGALSWVIYTSGTSLFPTWSPYRYTAMTTLLGLVGVYAINVVLIELRYIPAPSIGQAWTVMPQLLYMSLVAGAIAVLSWNMGNKIITPLNGVPFTNVVPVVAFAVSALSGIVPTPVQLAGVAITIAALVMNYLFERRRFRGDNPDNLIWHEQLLESYHQKAVALRPSEQPKLEGLVKLNANENPYWPSPRVVAAIIAATDRLHLHPDPRDSSLGATIASRCSVVPEQVFVRDGSDEVLAHTFDGLPKPRSAADFS